MASELAWRDVERHVAGKPSGFGKGAGVVLELAYKGPQDFDRHGPRTTRWRNVARNRVEVNARFLREVNAK